MIDDLGACEGGGWTLVMKIDGNQVYTLGITQWSNAKVDVTSGFLYLENLYQF